MKGMTLSVTSIQWDGTDYVPDPHGCLPTRMGPERGLPTRESGPHPLAEARGAVFTQASDVNSLEWTERGGGGTQLPCSGILWARQAPCQG